MSENDDPAAIHFDEILALLVTPTAIIIIVVLSVMLLLCCFGCFCACEMDNNRKRLEKHFFFAFKSYVAFNRKNNNYNFRSFN